MVMNQKKKKKKVMNLSKLQEIVEDRGPWSATVHEVTKSRTYLSD